MKDYLATYPMWGTIGASEPMGHVRYTRTGNWIYQEQDFTTSVPQGWYPIRMLLKVTPC